MFLPQDRVQDFTKMNPQELLHNTQISACAPEVNETFNKLVELRGIQKNNTNINADIQTRLTDHRNRNEQLRALIESNKLKNQLIAKLDVLMKKRAWLEYDKAKEQLAVVEADLNTLMDKVRQKNLELKPLLDKQQQIAGEKADIRNAISKADTRFNEIVAEMDRFEDAVEGFNNDVSVEKQRMKNVIESVNDHKKQIEEMTLLLDLEKNELQIAREALEADESIQSGMAACDDQINQIRQANEQLMMQRNVITKKLDDNIIPAMRNCERKVMQLGDTQRQRLDVLRNQFEDAYKAYEWLQQNRQNFRGRVFNPILVEITVNEKESAKYIESTIAVKDLVAFVCTDKDDMKQLIKKLRNEMGLQVNFAYSEDTDEVMFQSAKDITEYPPSLGLYSYLIDTFNGPAPIVNYLCRLYHIHQVAVGDDRTFNNAAQVPAEIRLFFSTNHRFSVTTSRYSHAKSTSSVPIQDRNILNVGVDVKLKEREEKNLAKWRADAKAKRDERAKLEAEIKSNEESLFQVRNEKKEILKKIQHVKLTADKLRKKEADLEALKNRNVDIDAEKRKNKAKIAGIIDKLITVNEKRIEKLVEFQDQQIERAFAKKKMEIFDATTGNVDEEIRKLQTELAATTGLANRIKDRRLETLQRMKNFEEEAMKLTEGVNPSSARFKYKKQFAELSNSLDELQNEVDELRGRIDCMRVVDPKVLTEYDERRKEIETLEHQLANEVNRMESLEAKIVELHARWFPAIDRVVATINQNFSDFFKKMGFVGEVELIRKQERDYSDYGIQIRVQYRDNEKLQALNRHVQSGGERAVAIAVYTLSLQHLTSVPFRCVDEINQGMDPKNERKIFQMLVDITCQKGESQYFFVTPKLLPDLPFSPLMTVHVVHNGKHIDDPYVFLDVEESQMEEDED